MNVLLCYIPPNGRSRGNFSFFISLGFDSMDWKCKICQANFGITFWEHCDGNTLHYYTVLKITTPNYNCPNSWNNVTTLPSGQSIRKSMCHSTQAKINNKLATIIRRYFLPYIRGSLPIHNFYLQHGDTINIWVILLHKIQAKENDASFG